MRLDRSKLLVGCLLAASSLYGATAFAQSRGMVATGEPLGFYAGAGIGYGKAKDACDLSGTGFVGTCDDKDTNWNIFAGYQFHPNVAVELGYVDLGEVTASGAIGGTPVNVSADANGLELVGVASYPFATNFSLYGKAGVFLWDSDGSGRVGGAAFGAGDDGTDFTGGLGVQYRASRNIATRLGWQHYNDVAGADVNVLRVSVHYTFW